jgi:hypothetical protein
MTLCAKNLILILVCFLVLLCELIFKSLLVRWACALLCLYRPDLKVLNRWSRHKALSNLQSEKTLGSACHSQNVYSVHLVHIFLLVVSGLIFENIYVVKTRDMFDIFHANVKA